MTVKMFDPKNYSFLRKSKWKIAILQCDRRFFAKIPKNITKSFFPLSNNNFQKYQCQKVKKLLLRYNFQLTVLKF